MGISTKNLMQWKDLLFKYQIEFGLGQLKKLNQMKIKEKQILNI